MSNNFCKWSQFWKGKHWSCIFIFFRYTWMQMPEHEKKRINYSDNSPFRSPTLVGCAFAVQKKHFFGIGGFDDAMNIWGGENIELAFRNWMCHGQVGWEMKINKNLFDWMISNSIYSCVFRLSGSWHCYHKFNAFLTWMHFTKTTPSFGIRCNFILNLHYKVSFSITVGSDYLSS